MATAQANLDSEIQLRERSTRMRSTLPAFPSKRIDNADITSGNFENDNALRPEDAAIHDWYRFVLSFPPHLVRRYLAAFEITPGQVVHDPFCGTGTTLVECRKHGIASVGVEAHPLVALASRVKTQWNLPPGILRTLLRNIVRVAEQESLANHLEPDTLVAGMFKQEPAPYGGLPEEQRKLIPEGFVSEKPLRRLLNLRNAITGRTAKESTEVRDFFRLAMCHVLANGAGNFAFGPEIYRTKPKQDYDVLGQFALRAAKMIDDLESIQAAREKLPVCTVIHGDARTLEGVESNSISGLITSPPYPNEKDYTRITRVESVLLGLIADKKDLRQVKQRLLRSNTRNVFVGDDDGEWVSDVPRVQEICRAIERRRVELKKTSGFERLYHRVVAHYFGGMARHFAALHGKLKRRARCAYVVGDQLSFLLVPIPTAQLLGEIAGRHGLKTIGCDLWRTRLGTKSGTRVREEILILEKR